MTDESDNKELATTPRASGSDGSAAYGVSTAGGQPSLDLLDLVRSAEEAATLATGKGEASATPPPVTEPPSDRSPESEEFVEVGDDAIDAPASLPPMRTATPATAFKRPPEESSEPPPPAHSSAPLSGIATRGKARTTEAAPIPAAAAAPEPTAPAARVRASAALSTALVAPSATPARGGLPPLVGILIMLALAIGALVVVTR